MFSFKVCSFAVCYPLCHHGTIKLFWLMDDFFFFPPHCAENVCPAMFNKVREIDHSHTVNWRHTVNRKSLQLLQDALTGSHLGRSPQSISFKSNAGLAFRPSCDPATKTPLWLEAIKSSGTAVQRIKHLCSGAIPSTELFFFPPFFTVVL